MDVQVKLWLKEGHTWEFCCDENDPVLIGLLSALPGAHLGQGLPQEGSYLDLLPDWRAPVCFAVVTSIHSY